MLKILKNNKISSCSEDEKKKIFEFAFGKEFMSSNSEDKGKLKEYQEKE